MKAIIKKAHMLRRAVEEQTSQYYHSTPLVESTHRLKLKTSAHSFRLKYGLKDLMLIGAITENPILLTGGTDLGKTALSCMMMNSLFGKEEEGWHRLDFDLDFGKDAFTNVHSDFFHESGKSLQDLYSIHKWMRLPGFIADELNGGHSKVIKKAIHIIKEKDITLADGRRVKIGCGIEDEKTYQYQIATINEGSEYSGTFEMDKALRRRTTIEIPLDIFKASPLDLFKMKRSSNLKIELKNTTSHFKDILDIFKAAKSIKLHPAAELFLSFLEALDYCEYSPTKTKSGLEKRGDSIRYICSKKIDEAPMGCRYLKLLKEELCPHIFGISPGLSKDMISVAQGAAIIRAVKFAEVLHDIKEGNSYYLDSSRDSFIDSLKMYVDSEEENLYEAALTKYINDLEVEYEDLVDIAPFVIYSKVGMSKVWLEKNCNGNVYQGLQILIKEACDKYKEGIKRIDMSNVEINMDLHNLMSENNPWLLQALKPYTMTEQKTGSILDYV